MNQYKHTYEEVANRFNEAGLPRRLGGPWTGTNVAQFYKNSLLFGRPFRNDKITVKNYETGRRRSVKNPEGRIEIDRPDLAFLDPAIEPLLRARFEHYSRIFRRARDVGDPLQGVARNRSRFPGRCLRCWYCGREYVWGGNGQRHQLMCGGSLRYLCWNSVGVDGVAISTAVTTAIADAIEKIPLLESQLADMIDQALRQNDGGAKKADALRERLAEIETYQQNLAAAIARRSDFDSLLIQMDDLQTEFRRVESELAEVKRSAEVPLLPQNSAEILASFREVLRQDLRSYDLGALLRPMVVSMDTHLIRPLDSTKPFPRTQVVLDLLAGWPDLASVPIASDAFSITLTVDRQSSIPQRCHVRERASQLTAEGVKQRDIATQLGVHQVDITRACRLTKMMAELGLDTPFVPVMSPEELSTKHRRQNHRRYRFEPLGGYEPRPL